MELPYIGPTITPTEAATYYNMILTGAIEGIGIIVLSNLIKQKSGVPANSLATWVVIFGAIAAVSVWDITRKSE